ncbi:MAG: hypothetical protein HQL23_00695 [Candidatus Omnitrophica bacterium]|nr:hypothetical protein [Candidatus Omnitrophota bacterium]
MKIEVLRELLKNKAVMDEIHKHLWIESQKAGASIGIERATDEWLRLHAMGWMKYHMPKRYEEIFNKPEKEKKMAVKKTAAKSSCKSGCGCKATKKPASKKK